MRLSFEWDESKANLATHRVCFDEAITVFMDPFSMTIPDSRSFGSGAEVS